MSIFYTAIEGKTWRGLPVYKFTGKREAIIDRGEFDFDGCEFIAVKGGFGADVIIHPESLPRLRDIIYSWPNEKFHYMWDYLIDEADKDDMVLFGNVWCPRNGVTISASELEFNEGTEYGEALQLNWPEFGVPADA